MQYHCLETFHLEWLINDIDFHSAFLPFSSWGRAKWRIPNHQKPGWELPPATTARALQACLYGSRRKWSIWDFLPISLTVHPFPIASINHHCLIGTGSAYHWLKAQGWSAHCTGFRKEFMQIMWSYVVTICVFQCCLACWKAQSFFVNTMQT